MADLNEIAELPEPPYYAVIFTNQRSGVGLEEYAETADRMLELARLQDGFLGVESARDAGGLGITVSYWRDTAAIRKWREQADHQQAQAKGRSEWYARYALRVSRVEHAYDFGD